MIPMGAKGRNELIIKFFRFYAPGLGMSGNNSTMNPIKQACDRLLTVLNSFPRWSRKDSMSVSIAFISRQYNVLSLKLYRFLCCQSIRCSWLGNARRKVPILYSGKYKYVW